MLADCCSNVTHLETVIQLLTNIESYQLKSLSKAPLSQQAFGLEFSIALAWSFELALLLNRLLSHQSLKGTSIHQRYSIRIAEVVDEVQDDSQMVVQSVVKIEKVLKKASASIDRGRPSASSTSHSSRSEFQEGESSHVDPHRNKVPKTMESQSPTNAELEQLVHAIADEYFKLRQTAEEHWG